MSTTRPPWVMSTSPRTASRPAAARTSFMSTRRPSGRAARAASDGQMDPALSAG
jgi:hypothetical protein